jgi:hypothetical protein
MTQRHLPLKTHPTLKAEAKAEAEGEIEDAERRQALVAAQERLNAAVAKVAQPLPPSQSTRHACTILEPRVLG